MPRVYKRKFNRKKKLYKKKKANRRNHKVRSSMGHLVLTDLTRTGPLPMKFLAKHRYVEGGLSLDPGVASLGTYIMNLNSLYDPNYTGVGHQPLGFDQMTALYSKYSVIGAKATIQVRNLDSSYTLWCGAYVNKLGLTTATDPDTIIEQGLGSFSILGPSGKVGDACVLNQYFSGRKFYGNKKFISDPDYQGDDSSSPANPVYLTMWCGAREGSAVDLSAAQFDVIIDYIAIWTEPKFTTTS